VAHVRHRVEKARLLHSVAVDTREWAELNAVLVGSEQQAAPRVRAMIERASNPDAVVEKTHTLRMLWRRGTYWLELGRKGFLEVHS